MADKPPPHTIVEGDCVSSIGFEKGFSIDRIWKDPDNATLKETRESPYVLAPGDVLVIPEKEEKLTAAATGIVHVFKRANVPETLQLRFLDEEGKPRAGLDYIIDINGKQTPGKTGDDGAIETVTIPPNQKTIWLLLNKSEEYELCLGELDPIETESGVCARLMNLGYLSEEDEDVYPIYLDDAVEEKSWEETGRDPARALRAALFAFQEDNGIENPTGEIDDETKTKLLEMHGS